MTGAIVLPRTGALRTWNERNVHLCKGKRLDMIEAYLR